MGCKQYFNDIMKISGVYPEKDIVDILACGTIYFCNLFVYTPKSARKKAAELEGNSLKQIVDKEKNNVLISSNESQGNEIEYKEVI